MSNEIKKGLLGIVVDETTISQVMPEINSLTYRGYAVQDLCEKCSFEEVAYLILNKELPNKVKLINLKNSWKKIEILQKILEKSSNTCRKNHIPWILQELLLVLWDLKTKKQTIILLQLI